MAKKKTKQKNLNDKPRPCFICPRCGQRWVKDGIEYDDVMCISCGVPGEGLNDGAKKLLKKFSFFLGD